MLSGHLQVWISTLVHHPLNWCRLVSGVSGPMLLPTLVWAAAAGWMRPAGLLCLSACGEAAGSRGRWAAPLMGYRCCVTPSRPWELGVSFGGDLAGVASAAWPGRLQEPQWSPRTPLSPAPRRNSPAALHWCNHCLSSGKAINFPSDIVCRTFL